MHPLLQHCTTGYFLEARCFACPLSTISVLVSREFPAAFHRLFRALPLRFPCHFRKELWSQAFGSMSRLRVYLQRRASLRIDQGRWSSEAKMTGRFCATRWCERSLAANGGYILLLTLKARLALVSRRPLLPTTYRTSCCLLSQDWLAGNVQDVAWWTGWQRQVGKQMKTVGSRCEKTAGPC